MFEDIANDASGWKRVDSYAIPARSEDVNKAQFACVSEDLGLQLPSDDRISGFKGALQIVEVSVVDDHDVGIPYASANPVGTRSRASGEHDA
jgi:hypothetical protein